MKWTNRLRAMRSASSLSEKSDVSESSTDKNCQKNLSSPFGSTQLGQELKFEVSNVEELIIRTVQRWELNEGNVVSELEAIRIYTSKLSQVRDDLEMAKIFEEICEERKAIMMVDGNLSEAEAEAFVSSLELLTVTLMQI